MELITEIWRRATSMQPAPPAYAITLVALLALGLVLVPAIWPYTRMLVTITHEGGHALAAVATGRRLQGIRLHADTSGLTLSSGRPRGPGMVITLLAGYLAPAIVGLGAVGMLILGYSLGLLWLFVILLALLLLQIRNFYGFAVIVGVAVVLIAVSWYASATVQSTLAYLLTWILLIAAPKPVIELIGQRRRRRGRQSDADQLSRLTRTPATLWALLFLVVNLTGLVVGTAILLPALAQLAVGAAHQLAAR